MSTTDSDPGSDPTKWDPFRDPGHSAHAWRDRANDVLRESLRRNEEDLEVGAEEISRRFGQELLDQTRALGDRSRLPAHLRATPPVTRTTTSTSTDDEGDPR